MSIVKLMTPEVPPLPDETLYEVLHGVAVEHPFKSFYTSIIASRLLLPLGNHVKDERVGYIVCECLFETPIPSDPTRARRPDVAFVSFKRWPRDSAESLKRIAWPVVPDLAVEVVSPTDPAEDTHAKVLEYFDAGMAEVWVVFGRLQQIQVFQNRRDCRFFGADELFDQSRVLPKFKLAVGSLFSDLNPVDG